MGARMKVIILCGGQGTRLREETEFRPKPMVEVGHKPVLWHIMKLYAHYGYRQFILALGYRGNMIKEYFLNYDALSNDFTIRLGSRRALAYHHAHGEEDFQVTLADTGADTLTAGRVRAAGRYLKDDLFMVTYGDGLADVDLAALVKFHKAHGKLATVTTVRPGSRFGAVEIGKNGQVASFTEKPQLQGWVNAGFFVFSRKVLEYLEGPDCYMEREVMERLVREGQLMAFRHNGFFFAMDTYREYLALNKMWNQGQAPWKVWDK